MEEESTSTPSPLYKKVDELLTLTTAFATTYRANVLPGSEEPESDTDHTILLQLVACSLARYCAPDLDPQKVAHYALVHDLVEAYAGDAVTIVANAEKIHEKEEKEALALQKIKQQFDDFFPWISSSIEEYERQEIPEARFIKVIDKLLPGLGHIRTDCITFKKLGFSAEEIRAQIAKRDIWVEEYTQDWPEITNLYRNVVAQVLSNPFFNQK